MSEITILFIEVKDKSEWLRTRLALWPYHMKEELIAEMASTLTDPMQPSQPINAIINS